MQKKVERFYDMILQVSLKLALSVLQLNELSLWIEEGSPSCGMHE